MEEQIEFEHDADCLNLTNQKVALTYRVRKKSHLIFHDSCQVDARLVCTAFYEKPVLYITNQNDLDEAMVKTSADPFCILSFHQKNSLDNLQCTESAMFQVINTWVVSAIFLSVLLKSGDQMVVFEDSSGFKEVTRCSNGSFRKLYQFLFNRVYKHPSYKSEEQLYIEIVGLMFFDKSHYIHQETRIKLMADTYNRIFDCVTEIAYQLMYVEPSGRDAERDPWSIRQTGIYHDYEADSKTSRIILLHPKNESAAQERIEKLAHRSSIGLLTDHPINIHIVIISVYLTHWSDHIESIATGAEEIRRDLTTIDIKHDKIDPGEMQTLRNLEDKVVTKVCRCLISTRRTVAALIELNHGLSVRNDVDQQKIYAVHQQLLLFDDQLEGFLNSAQILEERIKATLGLLDNILELQNHSNSEKIQKNLLELTSKNVDDNATVRFITVCTMIYLPASFMATLLGMNLFEFRGEREGIKVSSAFWLYIALTVPLTILTVGAYLYFKRRHDRLREKRLCQIEEETA
ncbi:hypothetical protein BS50DRAFT_578295 [Corynespora cassiicola Philippines]|uniref:Cora-domain-containing protein n=1 Tax=Corynespora cassiicola Philippines TaxID=1448308 RepID=A0A2T2N8M2_CORCC|nr:hypothetical protein BS50DRAFT_578295 [Corynespora cassiicola Philippines]